jgi:hypothetical protein
MNRCCAACAEFSCKRRERDKFYSGESRCLLQMFAAVNGSSDWPLSNVMSVRETAEGRKAVKWRAVQSLAAGVLYIHDSRQSF